MIRPDKACRPASGAAESAAMAGEQDSGASWSSSKGWRFTAVLDLSTPLSVLKHHGEMVGKDDLLPDYGEPHLGYWSPVQVTAADLGLRGVPAVEMTLQTDFGEVPEDGGQVLPFLRAYRTVVEAAGTARDRLQKLRALLRDPQFADVSSKTTLEHLSPYVLGSLCEELWIDETAATALLDAGFADVDDIRAANEAQLLAVPGVTIVDVGNIRGEIGTLCRELHVQGGVARALYAAGYRTPDAVRAETDAELLKVPRIGRRSLAKVRSK